MRRYAITLPLVLAMLLWALPATAQKTVSVPNSADEVVVWWDNSTAPHSNFETEDERINERRHVSHTSQTVFYLFMADPAKATGQAVVVMPGGGYSRISMAHEGFGMGEWFKENGITALVLKYRLPNGHPEVPLEDVRAAMGYLRDNAAKLGIDPSRVGVCGSSAGGHLAAYASNAIGGGERPAFSILFYPVVSGKFWFQNTFRNLLGEERTPAGHEAFSTDGMVDESTPPAMLILCDDDRTVLPENSMLYYQALKRHGVRASLHIYPSGGHGWAGNEKFKYTGEYRRALLDWLSALE